ncbi:hypothetical protein GGX14DRAFT_662412 [Mycena pura]|uniref:Flavin reductase like domain-containing protein n=1 Tax=Mycena pura TaxID=153505 RepID=A0AAD6V0U3_9AGAR|nr:hypothetical protein GGX14DRAFT_662412 [Mycena pura]
MSTPSESSLPSFGLSGFKYTQPPNPSWTFGQPITATEMSYALSISAIGPRPIAFVSSIAENRDENLAPFSWFNQVNPLPISVACTRSFRRGKDTANNIKATKGFTVNIISEAWVEQANVCSIDAPPGVSEWTFSGLTKEPSVSVKAARVKESAFTLECELLQIVEVNSGAVATDLILGTVKYIHVRNAVLNERGLVDPAKLKAVGRMGDTTFVRIGDGFRIPRPSWTQEKNELEEKFNISQ